MILVTKMFNQSLKSLYFAGSTDSLLTGREFKLHMLTEASEFVELTHSFYSHRIEEIGILEAIRNESI